MVDVHSEEYILGQNIRKYRIQKGWSQADLSIAVDVDRADISIAIFNNTAESTLTFEKK